MLNAKIFGMKNLVKISLREEYDLLFMEKVQRLTIRRTQKFTQEFMSKELNVSLRTIQNFEAYKSFNAYLLFGYQKILSA